MENPIIQKQLDNTEEEVFNELYKAIVDAFEETLTGLTKKEFVSTHATMAATMYAATDIINSHPPVMSPNKPEDAKNFKRATLMTFALQLDVVDMLHPDVAEGVNSASLTEEEGGEAE